MIRVICVGKIKENYLKELINDYHERINKYHKLEIIEVKDSTIEEEAKSIEKYLNSKDYNIACSIDGKTYSSIDLANHLNNLFIHNSNITFVIGGSLGLSKDVYKLCNEKISFSINTFPHGLFRGILLEQIYRCFKINNNETYHK